MHILTPSVKMCISHVVGVSLNTIAKLLEDPGLMQADVAGRSVYLGLAMTAEKKVHMKPQNLLVNLPLARES